MTRQIDRVVVNASPLILLFKCGLADLLPQLFAEVAVPNAVWNEIVAGDTSDVAATELIKTPWIHRVEVQIVSPEVFIWNLGEGESEVLSFAFTHTDYRAMVDDRAALWF